MLAGAVISTAVLTGALVVGDSVKYSLQKLTDARLGRIRYVLNPGDRYVREKLADDLSKHLDLTVVPVLQSEGIAINSDKNKRINRISVTGVDDRFMQLWETEAGAPGEDEAVISNNSAEKLDLKPGDEFLLRIEKNGKTPRNAPFSAEGSLSVALRLKVKRIAGENQMGRFSLKSNHSAPFNIFISLKQMESRLGLTGSVNLILIPENKPGELHEAELDSQLRQVWQFADAGINIRKLKKQGTFEIRSDRIFFDDRTADAIISTIKNTRAVLTYLANSISTKECSAPYSFVAAGNELFLERSLSDKEIIINEWLANDLNIKPGDSLHLRYYLMGPLHTMKEDSCWFEVRSVVSLKDPISDPGLMPDFPGISDAGSCRDWKTGSPIDLKKIRDKDEKYWREFRGTPKAFISLKAGQKLWNNKFGKYTAFRFDADDNELDSIEHGIMGKMDPSLNGLVFQPVYEEGKTAASQSTDFGGLFLGLGFFIIFSGLLLTSMLFSLHASSRLTESAIMTAVGFTRQQVIRIMFFEVTIISAIAGILGAMAGILYNGLVLYGLKTMWQAAVRTPALEMHLDFLTLATGAFLGMITSMTVLIIVLFRQLKSPVSLLLKGKRLSHVIPSSRNSVIKAIILILAISCAGGIMFFLIFASKTGNSMLSLLSGGFLLFSGIATVSIFFDHISKKTAKGISGFCPLAFRNSTLNRSRVLGAITLLAVGTFIMVITGANRRSFFGTENSRQTGTGGFLFWAESTLPLMYDLNTSGGKDLSGIENTPLLQDVHFIQMVRIEGDDASCLNLNHVSQPVILGINSHFLDSVLAFSFVKLDPSVDSKHPWKRLDRPLSIDVIPGYADHTVIQWGLRKSVGDTLIYRDESGKILKVKLMGSLDNSIFQGNLLVSDSLLDKFYPSVGGSKVMLVDAPVGKRNEISSALENGFKDYGMMVTPVSERLALFNSVQNTYLAVFMLLGGLGVIIGTFGLGFFIFRNILGRQYELATYIALGFRKNDIIRILTLEFLFILLSGITIGSVSSLAAILPLFLSPAFQFPGTFLFLILLIVFLSGFLWIIFPVWYALKQNIIQVLRGE